MERIKDNSSVGCQESNTKGWSHPSDEEGWKNSPLRELDGPLSLEERRTCETPPGIQEATCAPGDNVKDEGWYRAVFTEQGVSVSQMAAAKFLDAMSKLLGVAGETSDAISAYTRVKMTEAPRLLRMPKEECPEMWIRIPPRQIPTGWDDIEDPSGTSWKKLMWSPTGWPCLGKKIWRSDIRKGWE